MWQNYKNSINRETYKKQLAHFDKWKSYIEDTGLRDVWLQSFKTEDQNFSMAGFAQKIRENCYGKVKNKKVLMADTVGATINSISTTFCENALMNPALDANNAKCIFLSRQLRSYKNEDPAPEGQQCLPLSVFLNLYNTHSSDLDITLNQLIGGALFFGCRSCEYSKVNNDEDRKTDVLRLENLRFFKDYHEVTDINTIHQADFIEITFICQKTQKKHQSVIQHKASGSFCPVKIWAAIKKRILSYPLTSERTKVNTFLQNGHLVQITSSSI